MNSFSPIPGVKRNPDIEFMITDLEMMKNPCMAYNFHDIICKRLTEKVPEGKKVKFISDTYSFMKYGHIIQAWTEEE